MGVALLIFAVVAIGISLEQTSAAQAGFIIISVLLCSIAVTLNIRGTTISAGLLLLPLQLILATGFFVVMLIIIVRCLWRKVSSGRSGLVADLSAAFVKQSLL